MMNASATTLEASDPPGVPMHSVLKSIPTASSVEMNQSSNGRASPAPKPRRRRDSVREVGRITMKKDSTQSLMLGSNVLILLFSLGIITGVLNGCFAWLMKLLSQLQALILTSSNLGPFYFMLTTSFLAALSAFIIKVGNLKATHGTGMAEVKALLVSEFHPSELSNIVSAKIAIIRVTSLILAVGSGLSIGIAAPLVHVALCTAHCIMSWVPLFQDLLYNPAMLKQIFAAAAAVGMSTVFNAPVGGLLFSIEVTSTYYLISNYWRSFMAATTGALMYSIFLAANENDSRIFEVTTVTNPYKKWEYLTFAFLGLIAGLLALLYLKFHQAYYLAMRRFFPANPIATAAFAGAITSVLIYAIGAHSSSGVSETVLVKDIFTGGDISEMQDRQGVSRIGGLFAALVVRVALTVIGTTLRLSAGIFLPMFTIGAIGGRLFGQIVANAATSGIYVEGYAMVGAAAFLSGTTHTISAAVIVVEMTGEIDILLPCLIASVIACGITKTRTLSMYDQGMVNKGLESFELLLEATGGFNFAEDVMDAQVTSVTRSCTVSDLFVLMQNEDQGTFPVIESHDSCKLVGSLDRRDVFSFLKQHFAQQDLENHVVSTFPLDEAAEQKYDQRQQKIAELEQWMSSTHSKSVPGSSIARRLFPSNYVQQYVENRNSLTDRNSVIDDAPLPATEGGSRRPFSSNPLQLQEDAGEPVPAPRDAILSPTSKAMIEALLSEGIDLTTTPQLPMNGFPFTAQRTSTMDQLYILFEMVKAKVVFVVADNKDLEGMISKALLLKSLKKKVN